MTVRRPQEGLLCLVGAAGVTGAGIGRTHSRETRPTLGPLSIVYSAGPTRTGRTRP